MDQETIVLRKIANAAKLVKKFWLANGDYVVPKSEPLRKLFSALDELEEYEKAARKIPDESAAYGNDCPGGKCEG